MEHKILYSNEFMDINMINSNYPFLVMKKKGVVIVPYDEAGYVYLIHKIRPYIGEFYEFPRGFVETNEDFITGAIRELLEETGMNYLKSKYIGNIQPDTGIMSNSVKTYALLVTQRQKKFEHYDNVDKEISKLVKVSVCDIDNLIYQEKIICGYTLSALSLYRTFINLHAKESR